MTPTTKSLPVREIPDMHRYCEEMGQPPFDWNAFLAREDQTEEEWISARELSLNWVTCACGNQCARLPRYEAGDHLEGNISFIFQKGGQPRDARLANYGQQFFWHISNRHRSKAKVVLAAIELRSAALLAQGKGAQS